MSGTQCPPTNGGSEPFERERADRREPLARYVDTAASRSRSDDDELPGLWSAAPSEPPRREDRLEHLLERVLGRARAPSRRAAPISSSALSTWPLGTAHTRQRSCVRMTSGSIRRIRSTSSRYSGSSGSIRSRTASSISRELARPGGSALRDTTGFVVGLGRPVALVGHGGEVVAEPERVHDLGRRRQQRDDPHRGSSRRRSGDSSRSTSAPSARPTVAAVEHPVIERQRERARPAAPRPPRPRRARAARSPRARS